MQKNEEYIVEIIDTGFKGEGIAKIEGIVVFVPQAIRGEKIKIKILKVTSKCAYGKIIEILEASSNRVQSDCETYNRCGGCNLRHIDYKETLKMKKNAVENTLKKTVEKNIIVRDTIGMKEPFYYRNKLQYPVGVSKTGETVMGVFSERTHTIIPTEDCKIQNRLAQKIANSIFEFINKNKIEVYNEKNQTGIVRHIIVRIGIRTNEAMVTLVVNKLDIPFEKNLVNFVVKKFPQVKTIAKNLKGKTRERLGKMLLAIGQVKGEGFVSYADKRVATDFSLRTNIGALSLSGKLTEGNRFDTDINSSF